MAPAGSFRPEVWRTAVALPVKESAMQAENDIAPILKQLEDVRRIANESGWLTEAIGTSTFLDGVQVVSEQHQRAIQSKLHELANALKQLPNPRRVGDLPKILPEMRPENTPWTRSPRLF